MNKKEDVSEDEKRVLLRPVDDDIVVEKNNKPNAPETTNEQALKTVGTSGKEYSPCYE